MEGTSRAGPFHVSSRIRCTTGDCPLFQQSVYCIMGPFRSAAILALMTGLATVTYFFVLKILRLDYPQAVAAACIATVCVPFAVYKEARDMHERTVLRGYALTLVATAAVSAVLPFAVGLESWLFPAWYFMGILGVGAMIRLASRLEARGPRLSEADIERKKEMRYRYMSLEEDFEAELDESRVDERVYRRKERILAYLRDARARIEEDILDADGRASLRPPPAIGSDPEAAPTSSGSESADKNILP